MQYPLISEYIEAISDSENFATLTDLRPVLDDNGNPIMSSGNFAVVFQMVNICDNKFYALKCFTREQEGREWAYQRICDYFEGIESEYLINVRYVENELFVDTTQSDDCEFPILIMDWIEGKTLDKYVFSIPYYRRAVVYFKFLVFSDWLLNQEFAHGDLKPDNIIIDKKGDIKIIDYDGMYIPSMNGEPSREHGSPDYRHPAKKYDVLDTSIDDFAIAVIRLSLSCIAFSVIDTFLTYDDFINIPKRFKHIIQKSGRIDEQSNIWFIIQKELALFYQTLLTQCINKSWSQEYPFVIEGEAMYARIGRSSLRLLYYWGDEDVFQVSKECIMLLPYCSVEESYYHRIFFNFPKIIKLHPNFRYERGWIYSFFCYPKNHELGTIIAIPDDKYREEDESDFYGWGDAEDTHHDIVVVKESIIGNGIFTDEFGQRLERIHIPKGSTIHFKSIVPERRWNLLTED